MSTSGFMSRRTFLKLAGAAALSPGSAAWSRASGVLVNDVHSQLNPTRVSRVVAVSSVDALQNVLQVAGREKRVLSLCGGRHAGGSQQFGTDAILVDTTKLNRVLRFDPTKGFLEVESGIRWPELLNYLNGVQKASPSAWGIAQKQTGTDLLTLGGTLSANAHGQGLRLKPFIGDVESFVLIDAQGKEHECSRNKNSDLFRLAIGGYGLFGVIYSVTLRLVPRRKVERTVEMIDVEDVIPTVQRCISQGYPYGDFQFNIDEKSDGYLKNGIFSGYRPVELSTPVTQHQMHLGLGNWFNFVYEAHVNKHSTFEQYSRFYQSTSGVVDWADVWQMNTYMANYHSIIDRRLHSPHKASEVLTEIYVPHEALPRFIEDVRTDFLKNNVNLIYSTVRFIEKDDETFLAWAKQSYVCVIFNLHTVHTPQGIEHSASTFRRLIDLAIKYGGSYYLTYHKYATREQVLACYPQFPQFLELKRTHDPEERFQSDWYRHYKQLLL